MKRIFILNDKTVGGGAEVVMREMVNHLRHKYKITVMTFDDDYESFQKTFPDDVEYIAGKIIPNPYGRINPLRYLISIYNRLRLAYIRSRRYDIVIANKEGPCMKLASGMKAEKKLGWVHADYRYMYWTRGTFSAQDELNCMKCFDHIVCVSKAEADGVKEVIGNPENLCVRYNPIDFSGILKNAEESTQISRNYEKPLFVAVGRIVEQKNFITLAKVCARLAKEFDFELWIVGDGIQREAVESVLDDEGCVCVKILGMQSNPHKYLAKADFLVSTALWESYGLVIQEALILGVPVFTTRCPAIEECFDERFGMIVDCNEHAIEEGLRYILENPECVDKYKEAIQKEYDIECLWDKRLKEIEDLIG